MIWWWFFRYWIWNILIWIDQGGNVIFLFGDPDETISSNTAKRAHKRGWKQLGRFLEWIDPGHLDKSLEADEGRYSAMNRAKRKVAEIDAQKMAREPPGG